MSYKYNSLDELRRKKELLKKEIADKEDLLTFNNAKRSLSAFTNGYTDQFLKEELDEQGEKKITLKKNEIVRRITGEVKNQIISKSTFMSIADTAIKGGVVDNALKLWAVAFVGNFAKNNIKSSSWKKKLIGIALIYIAPFALRFIRKKLEEYQKNKSVSSMEQLI
ncbi:phosphoribosyl-ATP pyrophosphatase [Chryseobacterium lacus]|uniref:Phosphoribosyl-ATP pyrophosphatase n=1 Tax=Chryseobacterium lacus TaxID=2058346 RepID=A0A368MXJ3_9FLAO|nr:phosphoribosyl-ATP pyrophosphatase [Chryseobacterium lacus]RCU42640.1 phosphoribosyl-ATP pyrophosphatase [Chryseobacterium lacus]RST27196.1 phosphoribosyl-ATP pyrophosphatase [Chryseobacterium lacus]